MSTEGVAYLEQTGDAARSTLSEEYAIVTMLLLLQEHILGEISGRNVSRQCHSLALDRSDINDCLTAI